MPASAPQLHLESTAGVSVRLRVLGAALGWLRAGHKTAARLLGAAFDETSIRTGMERSYRELAHETTGMWGLCGGERK